MFVAPSKALFSVSDELTYLDAARFLFGCFGAKILIVKKGGGVAIDIKKTIKEVQKETGIKGKQLFMPIRVAVTGQMHGPELPNTIEVLGKDKVLSRLKKFV